MNARQILEIILTGKTITLAFPNQASLATLRSSIGTYRRRQELALKQCGFAEYLISPDQKIQYNVIAKDPLQVEISIAKKPETKYFYEIVQICDTTSPSGKN